MLQLLWWYSEVALLLDKEKVFDIYICICCTSVIGLNISSTKSLEFPGRNWGQPDGVAPGLQQEDVELGVLGQPRSEDRRRQRWHNHRAERPGQSRAWRQELWPVDDEGSGGEEEGRDGEANQHQVIVQVHLACLFTMALLSISVTMIIKLFSLINAADRHQH